MILFTAVKIAFISTYQQQAQQQRISFQWNGQIEYDSTISKELNTRCILIQFWLPFIPFLSFDVSANQTQFAAAAHALRPQIYEICFFVCVYSFFIFISPGKFNFVECCVRHSTFICEKPKRIFDTFSFRINRYEYIDIGSNSIWAPHTICAYVNLFGPKWQLN